MPYALLVPKGGGAFWGLCCTNALENRSHRLTLWELLIQRQEREQVDYSVCP